MATMPFGPSRRRRTSDEQTRPASPRISSPNTLRDARPAEQAPADGTHTGRIGDSVKLHVRVEHIAESGNGVRSYLVRDVESGNVLEWSSGRRYGIFVGEALRLSGIVAAHTRRSGQNVTRLRSCFNPLRVS